jgi:hypothetical protein
MLKNFKSFFCLIFNSILNFSLFFSILTFNNHQTCVSPQTSTVHPNPFLVHISTKISIFRPLSAQLQYITLISTLGANLSDSPQYFITTRKHTHTQKENLNFLWNSVFIIYFTAFSLPPARYCLPFITHSLCVYLALAPCRFMCVPSRVMRFTCSCFFTFSILSRSLH